MGSLRYLTHTRPDLSFEVGVSIRFMEKPTEKHLRLVKSILRYVKGTLDYGLVYSKGEKEIKIDGYLDNDLAMDVDDRRSTSGQWRTVIEAGGAMASPVLSILIRLLI